MKKKRNPFNTHRNVEIDHKNVELLKKFLTPTGRIKIRRYTNLTAAQQRTLARAIKRARHLALISFTR